MPIIKSAIKKMRQDKVREKRNRAKISLLKKSLKNTVNKSSLETLSLSFSLLDKAAKTGLIPKGRADRKKSRLAKKLAGKLEVKAKTVSKKPKSKKS